MSILATAGKARIYNTDGTGRDTYIGFNNGGNTRMYEPSQAQKGGKFPSHVPGMRVGGGSPGKKIHYHVDGTGRDSYIHVTDGGFTTKYGYFNDRDAYVSSLRGYSTNTQALQRTLYQASSK